MPGPWRPRGAPVSIAVDHPCVSASSRFFFPTASPFAQRRCQVRVRVEIRRVLIKQPQRCELLLKRKVAFGRGECLHPDAQLLKEPELVRDTRVRLGKARSGLTCLLQAQAGLKLADRWHVGFARNGPAPDDRCDIGGKVDHRLLVAGRAVPAGGDKQERRCLQAARRGRTAWLVVHQLRDFVVLLERSTVEL